MKLSVLDQSTASQGASQDAAIRETLALARHCDALGYHRYWVSEHHNSDSIVGTAPEVCMAIDSADTAAAAREGMEHAAAGVRANMGPWIRSRLDHALLAEALKRFRDRAQGPMLKSASALFQRMTDDEFVRLVSDAADIHPILLAQRKDGSRITVEAMSEGTRDQLYLALRLAALEPCGASRASTCRSSSTTQRWQAWRVARFNSIVKDCQ